jgi:hypothetical protein
MNGDVNELVELLRAEAEKHQKRSRKLKWIVGSIASICLIAWVTVVATTGHGAPDLVTPLPILIFGSIAAMAYSPKHKGLVAELAARRDPRIVSHLLEAAYAQEPDVRKLAEAALPDILGIWLSGDYQTLEPTHRSLLYRLLDTSRPVEVAEAALIATRSTGGPEALSYLESFQSKVEKHRITRWQRLSGKALETMADVRMREARRIIDAGPAREDVQTLEQKA